MTDRIADEELAAEGAVVVTAPSGLHARPAIKLARLAKAFESRVEVRADGAGEWVDAKSLVRLMALRVDHGTRLDFVAKGRDAEEAVAALSDLVLRNFDEHDGHEAGE